jgi:hypothetical protein
MANFLTTQLSEHALNMKNAILLWFTLAFAAFSHEFLSAQKPVYQIQGPHTEYEGPYYIRVFVTYVQQNSNKWTTTVDLTARTAGIISKLNSVYNAYYIYFVGESGTCTAAHTVITQDNFIPNHLHPTALDIFDRGDTGAPSGYAFNVPNTFLEAYGSYGTLPGSHSEVIVHEVGHCLGLSHIFTNASTYSDGCTETGGLCANGESDCYCCGDYVCDIPDSPQSIAVTSDCSQSVSPAGLLPEQFRNYMSYSTPGQCRDLFTEGQIKRMWAYLALAPDLQGIRIQQVEFPASNPPALSGNIVVESGELTINSLLEMLPGSTIRVKPGASLKVQATVTGACNAMWQGVIVEGTTFASQIPANQGQVVVLGTGKLEHSKVAIDVQDSNPDGSPISSTGGGIVKIVNGKLVNNTIGISFGPYASPGTNAANASLLFLPQISVDNSYRGADKPTCMMLDGVVRLAVRFGRFMDLRTSCSGAASRANGVDSKNAGFRIISGTFEGLDIGIRADKLNKNNGSFTVSGSTFRSCYKEIQSISTSGFSIAGNNFTVQKPDACPTAAEIMGVQIKGETNGFGFSYNDFSFAGTDLPLEVLIGTDCENLKEGLDNTIEKNTYTNLNIGNRAVGINSGLDDGLEYQCNTNFNLLGLPSDFQVKSGSIKKIQAGRMANQDNPDIPTGNVFSESGFTFENNGSAVDYYFLKDPNNPLQDPSVALGWVGINEEPLNTANPDCGTPEPCDPCPKELVDEWKERFLQNRAQWMEKKAVFSTLTNVGDIEKEAKAISNLRLAMNMDAGRILRNYEQDTVSINVDSIVQWLILTQTYQTDISLAKHYFFNGNYEAFEHLWAKIPLDYHPAEVLYLEFERLGRIFNYLQNLDHEVISLNKLPAEAITFLKDHTDVCDEAAYLSEIILWRNGVRVNLDCAHAEERGYEETKTTIQNRSDLNGYPNPAGNEFILDWAGEQPDWVRVFDQFGRNVCDTPIVNDQKNLAIATGHFNNGIYFILAQGAGSIPRSLTFIVQH